MRILYQHTAYCILKVGGIRETRPPLKTPSPHLISALSRFMCGVLGHIDFIADSIVSL